MKQWEPWSKYDEKGLARYVVPDAAAKAAELRLDLSRFDAEQQPSGRRLIAGELYRQLTARANPIRYAHEKYHPQEELQVIRTPGEILYAPGEGTCLDLALLFCGLCLSCDLLPVLVVLEGHALAAVSLKYGRKHHGPDRWDAFDRKELRRFEEEQGLLRDGKLLRRLVDQGEYIAVECTGFAQTFYTAETAPEGKGRDNGFLPFERAVAAGREQLGNPRRPFQYALDVHLLHQQGFGPIIAGDGAGQPAAPSPIVALDWEGTEGRTLLTALRDALADLYPDLDSARVVVADVGLDAANIAFSSRARTNWHNILSQAVHNGQVDDLLAVVRSQYPNNPKLQAVARDVRSFLARQAQAAAPQPPESRGADARRQAIRERLQQSRQGKATPSSATPADYSFFYVSLDKLDRLAEPSPGQASLDRTVVTAMTAIDPELKRGAEFAARCRRLRELLPRLGQVASIQNLQEPGVLDHVATGWAFGELSLKVQARQDGLVILEGELDRWSIQLSASETNFADYNAVSGQIATTSTNHWLFGGLSSYTFLTHFWILAIDQARRTILGSPVYLALPIGVLRD